MNILRDPREEDFELIAPTLRQEDRRELEALGHVVSPDTIRMAVEVSRRVQVWDTERGPAGLIGVTDGWEDFIGIPWVLGTEVLQHRKRELVTLAGPALDALGTGYSLLTNLKDARNTSQIRWLRRLGFHFLPQRLDFSGHQFLVFAKIIQ